MSNNLIPYQWQIGDIVLGPRTQYTVLGVQIQSYNVNNQDSQIPKSDQITMAQDSRQAQPIQFTIGVSDNAPTPHFTNSLPTDLVDKSSKLLDALQDAWFADDIKQQWGEYMPLVHCDGYGVVKVIWGRPRKFQYTPKTQTSKWRKVTAEFARMDAVSYAEIESRTDLLINGADPVLYTTASRANTWFRVWLMGPMSNPQIIVGDNDIQLGMDIEAGVAVEVSSYPWSRRIVDSNGINWRTKLIGQTRYLDQLKLPKNTPIPMSWSANDTTDDSQCVVLWHDAYNVI